MSTFATVNKITLHYQLDDRPDGIPLVFINSLGTDYRIWDEVTVHFTNRHPILRYDKRGHGLSEAPPPPYTLGEHTADLTALLDQLSLRRVILVGLSVGGMIALDFSARYPERVHALVLSDTAPQIGTAAMWNERIGNLRTNGMASMVGAILPRWFAPAFADQHPAAYQGYGHMLARTPLDGYTGTCEAIRDADLTDASHTIQTRTLVLCGEQDASTPPDFIREATSHIPDVRFELVPDAGHLPCVEQPDIFFAEINTFLEGL